MDKPELETLDYKPTIAELEKMIGFVDILPNGTIQKKIPSDNCGCVGKPVIHTLECVAKPTKALPEVKENLTPVIEPKTRVENNEVAGQPIKTGCATTEQPSQNAMIFEQVDGCISKALQLLEQIEVHTTDRRGDKQGCIWTLEGWYKNNFKHFKRAFE